MRLTDAWTRRLAVAACLLAASSLAGCADRPEGTLVGIVTVGPTCPVESDPPGPDCGDHPLPAGLEAARSASGKAVASFRSGEDGRYAVKLPAGQYWVRLAPGDDPFPACPTVGPVRVLAGETTRLDMACDSGIR